MTRNFKASEHPLRRGGETPSIKMSELNHLAFWRFLSPNAFDHASVGNLRAALPSTSLLHEPWSAAVREDPFAPVGIAATLLPANSVTPFIDIVMSALCLNAIRGNGGSPMAFRRTLPSVLGHRPGQAGQPHGAPGRDREGRDAFGSWAPVGLPVGLPRA
jgi:hypothetical protein